MEAIISSFSNTNTYAAKETQTETIILGIIKNKEARPVAIMITMLIPR
jgi:hypothetical protein